MRCGFYCSQRPSDPIELSHTTYNHMSISNIDLALEKIFTYPVTLQILFSSSAVFLTLKRKKNPPLKNKLTSDLESLFHKSASISCICHSHYTAYLRETLGCGLDTFAGARLALPSRIKKAL